MAQSFVPKQISTSFLLVLAATIYLAKANDHQLTETKLSLYAQDFSAFGSPNATVIPVAGIAGKAWTFTQFGTLYVSDDTLTETADPKSLKVGQLQGMYITSGLDGLNSHISVSVVFTSKAYNGSTLQLQGISKQFEAVREVSVVGGTGKFRLARGYATFETYFLDIPTQYSVVRCNVTVLHN
ncbi:dirigent protein 22-like [Juglans microcarpa x Juglans regia]|uniref:dirigent protein 22-like n=1 Tax=Juglans microcarpa x Juglans regia TaxID=2249226 RepID=UPI001B7E6066|nr:dirigent protein 22-like [Juglans microcarpa x Juglans regia]